MLARMSRRALLTVAPLLGALVLPAVAESRIEPGRGIAGVRMDMTEEQVRAAKGEPVSSRTLPDEIRGQVRELRYPGLRIVLGVESGVTLVAATTRRERTAEGVGVGSAESTVRRRVRGVRCATELGRRACRRGRLEAGRVVTDFRIGPRTGRVREVIVARVID